MVISGAGNIDHSKLTAAVEKNFGKTP